MTKEKYKCIKAMVEKLILEKQKIKQKCKHTYIFISKYTNIQYTLIRKINKVKKNMYSNNSLPTFPCVLFLDSAEPQALP